VRFVPGLTISWQALDHVWIADQGEAWKVVTLLASTDTEVRIEGPDGPIDLPRSSTLPYDPSHSLDHEVSVLPLQLGVLWIEGTVRVNERCWVICACCRMQAR
jgi:hypothetical protein